MLNITVSSILDKNQPVVSKEATLGDCIDRMREFGKGFTIILDSDIAVGIITERDILKIIDSKPDITDNCLKYATKNLISIPADRSIYFAINIMIDNNIRRIVINRPDGKFAGCLTLKELMFKLEEDSFKRGIKLGEIVSKKKVLTVFKDSHVADTVKIMKENNIGSVAVVDRQTGKLCGIITERDFVDHFREVSPQTLVGDIMSPNPITVYPELSVYEAIKLMEEKKISRLIVMEGDEIVGLVNYRDIVKILEENQKSVLENKLKHARQLLDLIPEIMIEVSDEMDQQNIIWANRKAREEFGNIIGKKVFSVIPKEQWMLIHSKLLLDKTIEKVKFESKGKVYQLSGTYLPVESQLERGRIKFLISDITTEQKNMLHINKELKTYKKIINHAEDMIIIYEADNGKLKLYNDAVIKKLGYTTDELENMTIFDIVDEDRAVIEENIQKIVRKNAVVKGKRFYREVYGEKLPVEIVASKVDFNSVPHVMIVARDISERLKLEDEINRKNFELKKTTEFILNLNRAVSEKEAYDILAHMLITVVGVDSLLIYKINPSLNRVYEVEKYGKEIESFQECLGGDINKCKVIITNQPFLKFDSTSFHCSSFKGSCKSYMCMNIMSGGKVIAVANMVSQKDGFFDEEKRIFIGNIINAFSPFVSTLRLLELTKELSIRDHLTGLYNRRFVYEFFDKKAHESIRKNEKIGILLIDIDNFKKLNDTYGHDTGDSVIKFVARVLKNSIREMDIAGRWGGEEFLVMLSGITEERFTADVAERIRRNIDEAIIYTRDGKLLHITVSIGVAIFPDDGQELDLVIKKADEKLYKAKQEGKNMVVF